MKRMLVGLISVVLLVSFTLWAMAAEEVKTWSKLKNEGFEETEQGKPKYWTFFGPEAALVLDENIRKEGKRSIQIFLQKPSQEGVRLQLPVEVEAFKRYDLGGWIKTENLQDGYAQLSVIFVDKDRNKIERVDSPKISGTQDWTSQHMWIESPTGADVAYVTCFVKGKGKAWFDNIRFTGKLQGGY